MRVTEEEAFKAMYAFLLEFYERTGDNSIAALLGSLSLLPDGKPADSALWSDWIKALEKAVQGEVDASLRLG